MTAAAGHVDPASVDALLWNVSDEDDALVMEAVQTLARLGVRGTQTEEVIHAAGRILHGMGRDRDATLLYSQLK